jgi:hypothetical protein
MIQRTPTKESRMRSHGPRQFMAAFIAVLAGTIGLGIPPARALPNDLFVSSLFTNEVLQYNGTNGASTGAFGPARSLIPSSRGSSTSALASRAASSRTASNCRRGLCVRAMSM